MRYSDRSVWGALVGGPEEGAHDEAPLMVDVADHGEVVLSEETVECTIRIMNA